MSTWGMLHRNYSQSARGWSARLRGNYNIRQKLFGQFMCKDPTLIKGMGEEFALHLMQTHPPSLWSMLDHPIYNSSAWAHLGNREQFAIFPNHCTCCGNKNNVEIKGGVRTGFFVCLGLQVGYWWASVCNICFMVLLVSDSIGPI